MRAGAPELTKEGEQVIPVVKEELAVGKQASERRYRIRTYVVETPIEQQVSLRDERVIVERRPASGAVGSDADALREREFDVVERREDPVVEKRVRPVEEVVVHREANERVEIVRDTVRETKVDVDKELAELGAVVDPRGSFARCTRTRTANL
jgi:stress response protein YsnF